MFSRISILAIFIFVGCASHTQEQQEDLELQLHSHRAEIQACYDNQAAQNNLIDEGTIRLRISQNKKGKITGVEEEGGFPGSEPVSQCISKKLRTWKLEKPNSDTEFNVRWAFVKNPCMATNTCPPEDSKAYTDEELDNVMNTRRDDIQKCSEGFQASTPDQNRKVEINFMVDPNGVVSQVQNSSPSDENAAVFLCISNIVQGFKFEPRGKNVKIVWSWVFPVTQWEVVH